MKKSNTELRSSLAAACALPKGANAGGTGLTTTCVAEEDVPLLPLFLRVLKFFTSSFASTKLEVDDFVPWSRVNLDELRAACVFILEMMISWRVGRNRWLHRKKN